MPNENNTNQINSGDIGNFPDTALGQENPTHHSPAVREEAGQEKIQAIVEREAKALDWLYEIPLDAILASDTHIGLKLAGRDGAGRVTTRSADDPLSVYPSEEETKRRLALLSAADMTPYSYYPPMLPYPQRISVTSIRSDSSKKARLRKIRQLVKRIKASTGVKRHLFKQMLARIHPNPKVVNSSISGAHYRPVALSKKARKIQLKRARDFRLYGVPFPKVRVLSMVEIAAQFGVSGQHQALTRLARGTSGLDGDLSGTSHMREGISRLREIEMIGDEVKRVAQSKIWTAQGVVLDFDAPDENCKGCDNCEKKLPVLELMERGLDLVPAAGETLSLAEQLGDISIKDAYPEQYVIQEVAAPDHQAMGEMQAAIHETLFPGKIVAQGSIDRTGNGDDAAGDERFALDA